MIDPDTEVTWCPLVRSSARAKFRYVASKVQSPLDSEAALWRVIR